MAEYLLFLSLNERTLQRRRGRQKHALADGGGVFRHRWMRPNRCLKHTHTLKWVSVPPRNDAVCASDVPESEWSHEMERNYGGGGSLEWERVGEESKMF